MKIKRKAPARSTRMQKALKSYSNSDMQPDKDLKKLSKQRSFSKVVQASKTSNIPGTVSNRLKSGNRYERADAQRELNSYQKHRDSRNAAAKFKRKNKR